MSETINSLEQALRLWEDLSFIVYCLSKHSLGIGQIPHYPLNGPMVHYQQLRNYLHELRPMKPIGEELMSQRFVEPYWDDKPVALGDLAQLPIELALWITSSKRVYQLDENIQLLLNATSVKNISWERVKLPFDGFGIKLAKPIIGTTEKETYDFVLVSSYTSSLGMDVLQFRLLPTCLRTYQPIAEEEKMIMRNFIAKGRWRRLHDRIKQYWLATPRPFYSPVFTLHLTAQTLKAKVTESIVDLEKAFVRQFQEQGLPVEISDFTQEMPSEGTTTARLIACLSLFLTTKHSQNIKRNLHREPKAIREQLKTAPIIDQTEIFLLSNSRTLTASEQEQCSSGLSRNGFAVSPHFREGCWRFPPNKATDPNAEKTVWVSPSFIHADRLPKGEQPNGSAVRIRTPQS